MQLVAPVRRMRVRYIFLFAIRGGARRERLSLIECISAPILDIDAATWKLAAGVGIGALINLAYRWSEAELKDAGV